MPDTRRSADEKVDWLATTPDAAQFLMAIVDVAKRVDANLTERARIVAERDKEIARISAASQGLRDYLDRVFAERRELHQGFFARLDKAIEDRDPETIRACVTGIVEVAKHSPLNDIVELRSVWADPDAVIEI
ncbi:hypothetical protein [Micromonospora aurantiaca (nom. illeg.)]|uniref:DUF47 family protein n=1 Tax=Micromonospora aurantiaca (nom. illeg.) TaxID=47850 RepID=A0ABQ6UDF9_9ACTN|nr:hypothetical protein [Micromonospora aurantiaca]ADL47084.1 hypothetical protein Micau_3558 [Micromonospora aurantiaca ATCC 27029]KAB1108663.1 hypothetical protein F6X54_21760 [Micromonospora aurantiaca]UFN91877.1 hypothetical protein LF814_17800 [Micromonospora aurantiaca]